MKLYAPCPDSKELRQELLKRARLQFSHNRIIVYVILSYMLFMVSLPSQISRGDVREFCVKSVIGVVILVAAVAGMPVENRVHRNLIVDPLDVSRFIWRRRAFIRCYGRKMLHSPSANEEVNAILTSLASDFIGKQIRGDQAWKKASKKFDRFYTSAMEFVRVQEHSIMLKEQRARLELKTFVWICYVIR